MIHYKLVLKHSRYGLRYIVDILVDPKSPALSYRNIDLETWIGKDHTFKVFGQSVTYILHFTSGNILS